MELLTTVVAFVIALGCLIVVHEFGHYVVARACGVKVLRFSVGFGRALWSRRFGRDATEWVIAAFPLGGYVKMLDEREGVVAAQDLPRAFNRKSVWRRIAIVVAGPAANFILAVVLYWILFVSGVPGMKPVIAAPAPGTPAAAAGFSSGDTLLKIGDEPVPTWQEARWVLLQYAVERKSDPVKIEVRSAQGDIRLLRIDLSHLTAADLDRDFLRGLGLARYQPPIDPVIGEVIRDGAADRAGLKAGDEIVAINGQRIDRWQQVVTLVRGHPGKSLVMEIRRDGRFMPALSITPASVAEGTQEFGRIGAAPRIDRAALSDFMIEVRYGITDALKKALVKTWDTSSFSVQMLGKMIVGEVSLKNLSGPITIADYAGQSAQSGLASYLLFLALISISLGVLNLLPIPLLDGGHLLYYTVEVLKGTPVSERTMEVGQHVGIALLFVLMAFALYNDINRLISG